MGWLIKLLAVVIVVFGAIQVVPYGRDRDDPRSIEEPRWDSSRTRQLVQAACFDCHSNVPDWGLTGEVAPFSWYAENSIDEARRVLNFSEWQRTQAVDVRAVVAAIRAQTMPPVAHRLLQRGKRLDSGDRDELIAGIQRTWDRSPPGQLPPPANAVTPEEQEP